MVNIIVSSDPRYNINKADVRAAVMSTLQKHKVGGRVEIGVNIVGDRKMHELNRQYKGIDSTTDILSFALEDSDPINLQRTTKRNKLSAMKRERAIKKMTHERKKKLFD